MIKGHTDCGGVKAAWSGNNEEELQGWICKIRNSSPDNNLVKDVSMDELTKEKCIITS